MHNSHLSKQIFNDLMNGKIINERNLENNAEQFERNPLYTEIIDNLPEYKQQYEMCGYDLIVNAEKGYLHIRDQGRASEGLKTDVTLKASIFLLMIGKYLNEYNYHIGKLTDASGGLTDVDFNKIMEMSDTQELLEKLSVNSDFKQAIQPVLVERNILLKKGDAPVKYILSDAGKAFFDEVTVDYLGSNELDLVETEQ